MKFNEICKLLEKLGKTTKRLEKILILRDFILKNNQSISIYIILDLISGNYQRKINKKNISISLKTIISVLSFISEKTPQQIEKNFNKIGDIGLISEEIFNIRKQTTLFNSKDLNLKDLLSSFEIISKTKGKDSNKKKLETLSKLFLSTKSSLETKYLSRIFVDDLRIGVSEGVIKEACVNSLFTSIMDIQIVCDKCKYINLNIKKCLNCKETLNFKNQENIISKKCNFIKIENNQTTSLSENSFKSKYKNQIDKFNIKNNNRIFLKLENPRDLYNIFLNLFEKKYNLINSFTILFEELNDNFENILKSEIKLGIPIRSMLGTRENTVTDSFKTSKKPALIDFKYDGLRIQIHNNKGKVKLFSRNLDNITNQFPEIIEYIQNNFSKEIFVIDSECVAYNFEKQTFLPFQLLSKRILSKNIDEVSHININLKIFDIMYLNNKTIIDLPYIKRREILINLMLNRPIIQNLNFNINLFKKNY